MGDTGSGNSDHWWRGARKQLVEDCLSIDAGRWTRAGILRAGASSSGSWAWRHGDRVRAELAYVADLADGRAPAVWLSHGGGSGGGQDRADYPVPLECTRQRNGGLRWWFLCPLGPLGRPCRRRCARLYLPPGARYFGCRGCHRLTYRSCQEGHRSRALMARLAAGLGVSRRAVGRALGGR